MTVFSTTPSSSAPKSIESVTLGPTHVLIVPVVVLEPGSGVGYVAYDGGKASASVTRRSDFDPVVTDLKLDFITSFSFL